eukprot:7894734-Alexandrium_andersonii.AAC.1
MRRRASCAGRAQATGEHHRTQRRHGAAEGVAASVPSCRGQPTKSQFHGAGRRARRLPAAAGGSPA